MFGGFEDERRTSEDITETLLSVMQVSAGEILMFLSVCSSLIFPLIVYPPLIDSNSALCRL